KGLKKTAKSNFGGGNTNWEESRLGSYAFSETRLVEIVEKLCESSSKDCYTFVEEHEELIEKFWFSTFAKSKGEDKNFFAWLCIENVKDMNECERETNPCSEDQYCGNNEGSYYCAKCHLACKGCTQYGVEKCKECAEGYQLVGSACTDIDECQSDPNPCTGQHRKCVNNHGGYSCDCIEGFIEGEGECIPKPKVKVMPLVIICGFPSSGKSRRSEELKKYLQEELKKTVHIISDTSIGIDKNDVYSDSKKEKDVRANLKSSTQRLLNKDEVVILDSLNYIKGFRYELYCVTKSCKTPHCVIFCDISKEKAHQFNDSRQELEQYHKDILDGLMMRFEEPNPNQRWDSPLFVIQVEDQLPLEQVSDALFHRKPPPPNMATQNQPLSSTNFLYELDKVTQDAVSTIMDSQKTCIPGDVITVKGSTEKVSLHKYFPYFPIFFFVTRPVTLAELQRHRRQFITYTKMHPVEDLTKIPNMFIQYLNNSLT
ncbi:hypothetical protein FSP39_011051, partial [Pinctada imbricata]